MDKEFEAGLKAGRKELFDFLDYLLDEHNYNKREFGEMILKKWYEMRKEYD